MISGDEDLDGRLEDLGKRIQKAAEDLQLTEMLDSVLILVTYRENGTTASRAGWAGNFYACFGLARWWFIEQERPSKD